MIKLKNNIYTVLRDKRYKHGCKLYLVLENTNLLTGNKGNLTILNNPENILKYLGLYNRIICSELMENWGVEDITKIDIICHNNCLVKLTKQKNRLLIPEARA